MQPADAVARVEFAPYVLCAMLHVECVVPLTFLIGPAGNGPQRFHSVRLLNWRRKRDSNPRATYAANGFQDRRLQPLGHSSKLIVPDIVFRSRRFFCGCAGERERDSESIEARLCRASARNRRQRRRGQISSGRQAQLFRSSSGLRLTAAARPANRPSIIFRPLAIMT